MAEFKKRKIYLEHLPKIGSTNKIDWCKTINQIIKFQYDEIEGEFKILDYNKKTRKVSVYYNDSIYEIKSDSILYCTLGVMIGKINKNFKIEIGKRFKDDKRDMTIIDREYREDKKGRKFKYYKYKCNKCPNEDWIEESNLLKGKSCNVCCASPKKILVGYNDIFTTHPEVAKYFLNEEDKFSYSSGSRLKVYTKCPDCGYIRKVAICDLVCNGFSCPKCGDGISYPNKFMFNILEQLNSNFKIEYSPDWLGDKRFDFYDKDENIIIEMDGGIGHGNIDRSHRSKEESKEIDNWKDEQARQHNIKVIRINCKYDKVPNRMNFIKKNILNSELINYYDFDKVDWNKANEYSISNLVKMVCQKKNDNPNISTNELMELFNLSRNTILNYLKIGSKNGWCGKYEPYRFKLKPVEVFKDGISLGIYESAKYLSEHSENIFGIKLTACSIGRVCRGERDVYNGFVFKYI